MECGLNFLLLLNAWKIQIKSQQRRRSNHRSRREVRDWDEVATGNDVIHSISAQSEPARPGKNANSSLSKIEMLVSMLGHGEPWTVNIRKRNKKKCLRFVVFVRREPESSIPATGECCEFSDRNRISPFLPQEFAYFMCGSAAKRWKCGSDTTVRTSYFLNSRFTISRCRLFDPDVNTKLNEFVFNFPIQRKSEWSELSFVSLFHPPVGRDSSTETGQFCSSHFDVDSS